MGWRTMGRFETWFVHNVVMWLFLGAIGCATYVSVVHMLGGEVWVGVLAGVGACGALVGLVFLQILTDVAYYASIPVGIALFAWSIGVLAWHAALELGGVPESDAVVIGVAAGMAALVATVVVGCRECGCDD